jgi:chaperonin GroES
MKRRKIVVAKKKSVKTAPKKMMKKKPQQVKQKSSLKAAQKSVVKKTIAKKVVKKKLIAKKSVKKTVVKKPAKKVVAQPSKKTNNVKKNNVKTNMKKTILTPLGDKIVVRLIEKDKVTAGGIIIPGTVNSDQGFSQGKVLTIGAGLKTKKGKIKPLDVQQGDVVLFKMHSTIQVEVDSEKLYILNESDVFGII